MHQQRARKTYLLIKQTTFLSIMTTLWLAKRKEMLTRVTSKAVPKVIYKKVFFKTSLNSQKYNCNGVFLLSKDSIADVVL